MTEVVWGQECDGVRDGFCSEHRTFEDRDAHLRYDLHMAMEHHASWFTAHLFRLIAKADTENLDRIAAGFPDAVRIFREVAGYGEAGDE